MNKIFILLFLLVCLAACENSTIEIAETYPDGSKKLVNEFFNKSDSTLNQYRFFENGNVRSIIEYKEGKPHGLALQFYESGERSTVIEYKNGVREGVLKAWYQDGAVRSYFEYVNGRRVAGANYFRNGQVIGELQFEDGYIKNGTYYYPDGTIRSKGQFIKENKAGTWYYYDSTGVLKDTVSY